MVRELSSQEPTLAVAFKISHDAARHDDLTYLRLYGGTLRSGDTLLNVTRDKRERVGKLLRMHANEREEIAEVSAGDICAAVGLRTAMTGDTLCDPAAPLLLEAFVAPSPVISVVVELDNPCDDDALQKALGRLSREDPTFQLRRDQTGRTIIAGMGELHLEIIADRLRREFGLAITTSKPEVAYRETVSTTAIVTKRFTTQIADKGQFAEVELQIEPGPRDSGVVYESKLHADFPKAFLNAIRSGVEAACDRGFDFGEPVTDVRVTLLSARQNVVDSTEHAFNIAASMAFVDAGRQAQPTLLEPIMSLELSVPDEHMGDVIGDLNARRGKITGIESRLGVQVVAGLVPLASMFGYATDLRSRTAGRASFSMQFLTNQEVPATLVAKKRHSES